MIQHCIFANNSYYGVSVVELDLQSKSMISIGGLNFCYNTRRGAMIYTHVSFDRIMISMNNIIIQGNYGYSVYRRGGFIYISILKDSSTVKTSNLNFTDNHFTSNGGEIYILGTFQKTSQFYIQNSYFANNFGFGPETIIYSSLTCTGDNTYVYDCD